MAGADLQAASMDLLQGFRAALRALGNPKVFAGGVQLTADTISTMPSPPPKALYQRHFDVVFLDAHGWNSFGAHVSRSQLAEVRQQCHLTLRLMIASGRLFCRVGDMCTGCCRRNMQPS